MRVLILTLSLLFYGVSNAQVNLTWNGRPYVVMQTSPVKDEAGKSYVYSEWLSMISSGEYDIKPIEPLTSPISYLLVKLSKEEQLRRLEGAPKPIESKAFKGKKKIENFETTDLNGQMVSTKSYKGKIVVLNFWFIRCPPCRMERPFLNQLVDEYKKDTNIVFLAVSLDPKFHLDTFLRNSPFKYRVIPDGTEIAKKNDVEQYPTHVIVDREGKIAFNSVSYNAVTGYWIRKTIDELRKKQ